MASMITDKYAITISRVVNAPRERVWQAFTDPEQVVQWWGPSGFTNTLRVMDVRPGGKWSHVMHGPDGRDYPNEVIFDAVEAPSRLVFTHHASVESDLKTFQTVVTFEDLGQKTKVTLQNRLASQAEKDKQVNTIKAVEGANQTLARLAEFVEGKEN